MRNNGLKFLFSPVAFTIGSVVAFLFLQKKLLPTEVNQPSDFVKETQSYRQMSGKMSSLVTFNGANHGCNNFIAYKSMMDNTKVVGISAEKDSLRLGNVPKTFDIGTNKNFEVFLFDFGKDSFEGYEGLCFDAINVGLNPIKLIAKSGEATISISNFSKDDFTYEMTVILENVTFQTPNKGTSKLERIEISNVRIGFLMG